MNDAEIDQLLSDLAADPLEPSSELLGSVLEAAYAELPLPVDRSDGNVISVFGGWSGLGGLAVAASVGFFMGFAPPAMVQDPLTFLLGDSLTLLDEDATVSGYGWDLDEDVSG